jgi:exoribonuclease II
VAPFKPKDAMLFSVISQFDAAYAAYNDFQRAIERFWTLRWLQQNNVTELDGVALKDGLVRADTEPLVFKALGCEALPRGSHVRVRITGIDEMTLDLHANLVERLDEVLAQEVDADEEELEAAAAPLTLAIDLSEATEPEAAPAVP